MLAATAIAVGLLASDAKLGRLPLVNELVATPAAELSKLGGTPVTADAAASAVGLLASLVIPLAIPDAVVGNPIAPAAVLILLNDGNEFVSELMLKSDTLGIELNIDPGLNVSNQDALPAKLPTSPNPPRLGTSKLGIPKSKESNELMNSVPKSVTTEPRSAAKLVKPPKSNASNPPLILLFS